MHESCKGAQSTTPEAFLVTAVQGEGLLEGDGQLCPCQRDGQCALLTVVQLGMLFQLCGALLLVPASPGGG